MLARPTVKDEDLIGCLLAAYGLRIDRVTFLSLGGDLSTAVYRTSAQDQTAYFCKLKRGVFDDLSVELPKFLSEQGIGQLIPPLLTRTGQLRAALGDLTLVVYPFVEGTVGYELELSERQWADFGAALKRIHATRLPPDLTGKLQRDTYSPEWREGCRKILQQLDSEGFEDPVMADAAAFLRPKRELVAQALERAEQLAPVMASRSMEFVLCHSDIHPGNLFIDTEGSLYIVDWDYPLLAPKERDLMFIGGGQGFMPYLAGREEQLFYRGYGPTAIDPIALAYYRYERCIMDFTVESERIFSNTLDTQDRIQAFETLQLYFLPGCTMEMAFQSDRTR